jgi:hypothetical protein
LGPTDIDILCLRTQATTPIGFIKPAQDSLKPVDVVADIQKQSSVFYWVHLNRLQLKTRTESGL